MNSGCVDLDPCIHSCEAYDSGEVMSHFCVSFSFFINWYYSMNALKQAQQAIHKHRDSAILILHSIERKIALVFFLFLHYLSYTLSMCGDAFLFSEDTGNIYKLIPNFCL